VYGIAQRYGVPYERLVRANRLRDPDRIEVGRRLTIPGASEGVAVPVSTPAGTVPIGFVPQTVSSSTGFQWPLGGGTVTSPFGQRESGHHDGIDIQAPLGTPVRAARGGRVLYSDWLRGYGNLVIIDHGEGLATVYAHNQRNFVRTGIVVRAGQPIASLGASGQTSAPHLHFEVRKQNLARDPLRFLPPMSVASRRTQGAP
jgi:murein DD-endopeptidase MepM/ murein hydrolase activator NlpD